MILKWWFLISKKKIIIPEKNYRDGNESAGRYESYQMQNEKDNVKAADSASSIDTVGEKQETTEYQEMQEKFLQNLMKTYMRIKQTGNRR